MREDKTSQFDTKESILRQIKICYGGRCSEAIKFGASKITTGASNDIQQATNIARNMVTRYGMSDKLGTVLYGSEHSADEVFLGRDFSSGQNYSEKTAAEIDDEIRNIISAAYSRCRDILNEHIDKLKFVAEFLLKNEFMDQDQFEACMSMDAPTIEEIEQIAKERKRKSEEENKTALKNIRMNARVEQLERERELLAAEALRENLRDGKPDADDLKIESDDSGESEDKSDSDV